MSSLKAYTILRPLDRGTHGEVVLAERNRDRKQFAIKLLDASNEYEADAYLKEALFHRQLQHPSIIACEAAFSDYREEFGGRTEVVCLVMAYADGGNLRQLIQRRQVDNMRFTESEIIDISICILDALHYVHAEHEVVHRDINSRSILICNGTIKVAGFSESKRLVETGNHTVRGTRSYMAPEIYASCESRECTALYGPNVDVFSVGMVVLDMATLEQGRTRDAAHIRERMSRASMHYSEEFMQWLTAMLEEDPNRRISMEEALQQAIECKSMVTFVPGSSDVSDISVERVLPPVLPL
eukprot:GILK01006320.1.p1 GENE.GILK01006320.1~~GILK01006320.1.p1  ORF type:complete len:298 (+),score=32.96 GILK01006320.1:46-939(+)